LEEQDQNASSYADSTAPNSSCVAPDFPAPKPPDAAVGGPESDQQQPDLWKSLHDFNALAFVAEPASSPVGPGSPAAPAAEERECEDREGDTASSKHSNVETTTTDEAPMSRPGLAPQHAPLESNDGIATLRGMADGRTGPYSGGQLSMKPGTRMAPDAPNTKSDHNATPEGQTRKPSAHEEANDNPTKVMKELCTSQLQCHKALRDLSITLQSVCAAITWESHLVTEVQNHISGKDPECAEQYASHHCWFKNVGDKGHMTTAEVHNMASAQMDILTDILENLNSASHRAACTASVPHDAETFGCLG
jgi:hypothetical protein